MRRCQLLVTLSLIYILPRNVFSFFFLHLLQCLLCFYQVNAPSKVQSTEGDYNGTKNVHKYVSDKRREDKEYQRYYKLEYSFLPYSFIQSSPALHLSVFKNTCNT